jgi:replication factor C large subunit
MLTEKYRPKKIGEYIGHKEIVEEFVEWMREWKQGQALILHGPPGVGKTSLVHAFAKENNLELIETNASDLRSSKELSKTMTGAVPLISLSKRGKIFLFDEIDGISGYEDKGGVGEMMKIIDESVYPVVLIANDPYDKKLQQIRKKVEMLQFKKLTVWEIIKKLESITSAEKVFVSRENLHAIAKKANGDLRSAITDLETIITTTKPTAEEIQFLGLREREVSIFEALRSVFKTNTAMSAKFSIGSVNKDPEEIFWWIENNIINEYETKEEIAAAYEILSKADIFRQRIRSRQNWRFLAYMIDLMTGGVALSKRKSYNKFTKYQYPQNIMIMGRTKLQRASAKEILLKMTKEFHMSSRKLKWEFLPYLKIIMKDDEFRKNFEEHFQMDKETSKLFD